MVVSRQASDSDLRTKPIMYSSALYGNPCTIKHFIIMPGTGMLVVFEDDI